ncbi:MAG: class I adenylate-forming enzyme family protein [Acidobacteriota bacterium]
MSRDPLLDAFDRRLREEPSAPMVVGGSRCVSVAEIDHWAAEIGRRLTAAVGAQRGPIAVSVANGPGFPSALLALRRSSRAAILVDHRTPGAERAQIARELGAVAGLDLRQPWPVDGNDITIEPWADGPRSVAEIDPDIAVIKLTSGSTGTPRGILTPSAALVADEAALTRSMELLDDERILAAIPMSHSYGLSSVVLPALVRRAVLVVPTGDNPFAPMVAARVHDVTFMPTVPAFLQVLVRMKSPPPAPRSLRRVISAGAPLASSTARRFRELYGQPVHVFYGASECGGITYDREGSAAERGTLGTPVDGVELTLETTGTVTVRSPAVARGMVPQTDAVLTDGIFRTRDLGTWQDGELVLEGRLDDLINVKGKKVHPREVERVLTRHPSVDDALVLGVPTDGEEIVVRAFVVLAGGAMRGEDADEGAMVEVLHAWCRERLAGHKLPRRMTVVAAIPRTSRGKPDRRRLLALVAQSDPAA